MSREETAGLDRARSLLGLGGVVGILLFWVVVFILGFIDPEYSHIDHAISVTAAKGFPYSTIGRLNFILFGLLIIGFAVGLHMATADGLASKATTVFLVIHGVGRVGEGFFSFDLANPTSLTSMLHSLFGVPGVLAMVLVPFVAALSFKRDGKWENLYGYTTATGVVFP
ncbi:MAG: DUF998 domain-containing protein, partial [Candidatus Geothermarchaeales archaeon]